MGNQRFASRTRQRVVAGLAALVAVTVVALVGCAGESPLPQSSSTSTSPEPAGVTVSAPSGAIDVDPLAPVRVTAVGGTLASVAMINEAGQRVDGIVTPDRMQWKNTEPLGYGTTYTVSVASQGSGGTTATHASTFTTVEPRNQTKVYLRTTGGYDLAEGGTYGVGTVVVAHFDEPVGDRAANPVVMDSSTFGLPINSRLGYKETISYATRISTDGVYLHQLDSTVWAQGNTNVSHGCLNLSGQNARWFYDFSVPGDVVEVINTGGSPLELWQNGDWSVRWDQWLQGSALT